MENKKPTYKKATSRLMQHLLSRYLKHDTDFIIRREEDYSWKLSLGESPFEGALVVPFLISNVGQWYIGWYRGKDEEGFYLVESLETREVCRMANCGFLYLTDKTFSESPFYHFSDEQYDAYERISKRLGKVSHWYVQETPVFNEDGSIDVTIRKKFGDHRNTVRYKNLREVTKVRLREQCDELYNSEKAESDGVNG